MNSFIDLTYELNPDTRTHPYDEPTKLYQDKFLKTDKFNGYRLETGLHTGTHIDVAMHLTADTRFISDFPPDRFYGRGHLVNLRDETTATLINKFEGKIHNGDFVLLFTGHGRKWGDESYFTDHPLIDSALCRFLIEKKAGVVGMDLPSPDTYPFEIHTALFSADILILENLANLHLLLNKPDFEVSAFPLKLRAEASPVRVVAKII